MLTTPGRWPECTATSFASRIERGEPGRCQVALLGLPDDVGVQLNGGRVGARAGPTAFREALCRFGTPYDGLSRRELTTRVYDAGDVIPAGGNTPETLLETHARVAEVVAPLQAAGLVVVCIGGGHDLSLPPIRVLAVNSGAPLGGINVDAHLDVRSRVGSGMPFRSLIEAGALDPARFVELGLGRFANEAADVAWLAAQGAELVLIDEVLRDGWAIERWFERAALDSRPGFVSIDLDGLDQSAVAGVSAKNPMGLSVWQVAQLAERAGRSAFVRHFDLMELCPRYDLDGKSARVAALLFLHFIAGFEARS